MLVVWGLPINGALWPMELTVNWMLGLENSRRFGQAGGVSKIGGWMGGVEALTGETFYAWYKYEGISDVFLNVLKIPRQSVIMLQSYPFQGIGGSWGSEAGSYQAKSRSWIQQNSFEGNSPKKKPTQPWHQSSALHKIFQTGAMPRQNGAVISPTVQQNDELAGSFKNSVNRSVSTE